MLVTLVAIIYMLSNMTFFDGILSWIASIYVTRHPNSDMGSLTTYRDVQVTKVAILGLISSTYASFHDYNILLYDTRFCEGLLWGAQLDDKVSFHKHINQTISKFSCMIVTCPEFIISRSNFLVPASYAEKSKDKKDSTTVLRESYGCKW